MISVETKDWLRKASGIWLLLMGAVVIASGIYGFPRIVEGTGDIGFGGIIISVIIIIFGIMALLSGISVLYETLWGMAFALSIILCIVLAGLSPYVIYPVICYILLGISIISTVFLFMAKSEF